MPASCDYTTIVVTACVAGKWRECLESCQDPTLVVCHDSVWHEAANFPAVRKAMSFTGSFTWGNLANVAAREATTPWLLFIHDDLVPPGPESVAHMIGVAEEANCKIVVPALRGDSRCERQSLTLTGWSHLTEYTSDACVLVRRDFFESLDGFPSMIPGRSFEVPYLQTSAYSKGERTAIDHEVIVDHLGGETISSKLTTQERRIEVAMAAKWTAERLGIPLDYRSRLALPRLVEKKAEKAVVTRYPGFLDIGGVRCATRGKETHSELLDLAANHAPSDAFELDGKTWRRFPRGDKFIALKDGEVFKISAHHCLGLGDTFFMMKLFACIKHHYPSSRIELYTDLDRSSLFQRCLDVDKVIRLPWAKVDKESVDIHRFQAFGLEDAVKNLAKYFGLEYQGERARYKVSDEDRKEAVHILTAAGWKGGKLFGVQVHGGWNAKQWCYTSHFVRQAVDRGFEVWLVGHNFPPRVKTREVICMPIMPVATLVSCISLCDYFIGFDSGATHAAALFDVPTLSLWGPHDPNRVLFDAEVYNSIAVRRRVPWADCGKDNCRATSGGSVCPLKLGGAGAKCIDEVTPAQAWELLETL